jgi:putative membrane protein
VERSVSENEYHSNLETDKEETVYAKALADGSIYETTVEAALKNPGGTDPIPDVSTLTDLINQQGEEEYTISSDGTIFWDNLGEDIFYKGTSTEELPVSLQIRYEWNDREVTPEQIAGQSGRVSIRFDYENQTSETITVDGQDTTVQVPFLACSTVLLPSDTFYNISVTNGKVLTLDDQILIIGYAFPGLSDSLQLNEYEPTEDVDIPDYVEITADTTDFQLDFTATILSNGLFADLEPEDLNDADDLVEDMKELQDASNELVDGTIELYDAAVELEDGVTELKDGVKEYTDGVNALDDGIGELTDGVDTLNENKTALRQGAQALQDGLTKLDTQLQTMTASSGQDEQLSARLTALQEEDPETYASLMELLNQYSTSLSTIQTAVHQLAQGSASLTEGIQSYTHGITMLYKGCTALSDGSEALRDGGKELNSGLEELLDGVTEFKDGIQKFRDGVKDFDEDGIQELTKLAGSDLADVIRRLRALKEADDHYQNFSGISEGKSGSVKFIIETDEITP